MSVLEFIEKARTNGEKLLAILIDPDKFYTEGGAVKRYVVALQQTPPDLIFVGGSLLVSSYFEETIKILKALDVAPVVIFPGDASQVSEHADAILNLSLISGRNPEFLIGQQVRASFSLYKSGIEIIPTGYVLIDTGKPTSVTYMSNTTPIPNDKPEIVVATALAGEQSGKGLIYLEGGSGASNVVSKETIQKTKKYLQVPIIVGGGINSKTEVHNAWNAGATVVVVGTAFENRVAVLEELVS